MFCSEIYKQSQYLELHLGGVQRVGLGFLLIQPVASLRQERKTEAAELFGEGTLCSARSETALR